jgi:MoaA/NifB/PqqE/SkfB family radical SAM enzyme
MPVSVCSLPIVRCNLACHHRLDDKTEPELGRSQRAEVAATLAGSGVLGVDVSGGEPLLIRELLTLLDVLVDGAVRPASPPTAPRLPAAPKPLPAGVDAVRISLDGPDAQTHDRWRGQGSVRHGGPASPYGIPPRSRPCSCAPPRRTCPPWSSWPPGSASRTGPSWYRG